MAQSLFDDMLKGLGFPGTSQANPYASMQGYVTNPFAPQGWGQWKAPTDETQRAYYTKNPDEAYSRFSRAAGGSPGGNLERFIRQVRGDVWSDYTAANAAPGGEGLMFTDTLTPGLKQQLWQQWQAQTPYQRGENYATLSAGRRV